MARSRRLSPTIRRRIMGSIRSTNTLPELAVRSALHRAGLRFRLHVANLPGSPDIVLPRHRLVVWVHGCFWHRHRDCPISKQPKRNRDYWKRKFRRNVCRDRRNDTAVRGLGWQTLVVWECETQAADALRDRMARLARLLRSPRAKNFPHWPSTELDSRRKKSNP